MKRLGFTPWVKGLDNALEGGIPQGYWVSVFGPPGAYKTLHALAWCLNAIDNEEKCVYVSTEATVDGMRQQLDSLGWRIPRGATVKPLYASVVDKNGEIKARGDSDLVVADVKTLRFLAVRLNRIMREEKSGSSKTKYLWYNDPDLLVYVVLLALAEAGILKPTGRVTPESIKSASLMDAKGGGSKYTPFEMQEGTARVVIDSIAPFIVGRYSIAGRIMTDVKYRLMHDNITVIVVNHVAKSREDEIGAEIGHVVDGRIKLWHEEVRGVLTYYGMVVKMRATDHSRVRHQVTLEDTSGGKQLVWTATTS